MKPYLDMIDEVLTVGTRKENRTGVDTISTFNFNYEIAWDWELKLPTLGRSWFMGQTEGGGPTVPLLTTKSVNWKNIVIELLWFLSGEPTIDILQRHKCKFWDAWADEDGRVPMAYGYQWRSFPTPQGANDQIKWVLEELRRNPMSRRLVVSAWAPADAQRAALPPCHMVFAFNVQNNADGEPRLCLHLTQRSCDLALGVPYNMASYGLLLLIFSHLTGIKPGIFAHTLLDLHIYTAKPDGSKADYDHVPGLRQQRQRAPGRLPTLNIDPAIAELEDIEALMKPDVSTEEILAKFELRDYNPQAPIKFKVAV